MHVCRTNFFDYRVKNVLKMSLYILGIFFITVNMKLVASATCTSILDQGLYIKSKNKNKPPLFQFHLSIPTKIQLEKISSLLLCFCSFLWSVNVNGVVH